MTLKDIVIEVKKSVSKVSIMQVVDQARTFVREHSLNSHWKYTYDITLAYSGTAKSTAAVLSDTAAAFAVDGSLLGQTITNVTDGSSGTITAVTATTITATLSGGTNNSWVIGDSYTIAITNDIHIPKTLNSISGIYLGDTFIPMTIGWEGYYNDGGDAIDPYSGNVNISYPDEQCCLLQEDYILHFKDAISSTLTLHLWCEKMLTDDISETTLTTTLALPDKMLLPMAYFILHRLYLGGEYMNAGLSMFWQNEYKRAYSKAAKNVNAQNALRRSLGKSNGSYPYQRTKGLR